MSHSALPTVAVLMGGPSREHPISIKSGTAIAKALREAGCQVHAITFHDPALPALPADTQVVFPALHGIFGEDGQIQELLLAAGMPFVGCDAATSRLVMDKAAFKVAVESIGGRCPDGFIATDAAMPLPPDLALPVIVKPNREGSTIGLTLVERPEQWPDALRQALACDDAALVEAFIPGIECTVGVLAGQALPLVEILPPGGLFDHDAKYAQTRGATVYNCPPQKIPAADQAVAQKLAAAIYTAIGARDMLRVDMILDRRDGQFRVLEGNSLPGFTATSLLPKAAAAAGISFQNLCLQLVRQALARSTVK